MRKALAVLIGLATMVAFTMLVGCKETSAKTEKSNYKYRTISVPHDIYVDPETGVQYIVIGKFWGSSGGLGITPRLDADGKPMVDGSVRK